MSPDVGHDAARRILLLDGGMSTTLSSLGYSTDTPLWGSHLLHTDPSAISQVHEGFAKAGADLVGTCTYQLTSSGLREYFHIDSPAAEEIMRSAITLASGRTSGVVLSLGPYGATLSPGQEYKGIYPPPYGPSSSSCNAFPDPASHEATTAEDALAAWHFDRLRIYAADREVWRKVAWIAFETVPLVYEIRAIRRAVRRLFASLRHSPGGSTEEEEEGAEGMWWEKKVWITSSFPEGRHPQMTPDGQHHVDVEDVLEGMLGECEDGITPGGIGMNCTNPIFVPGLVRRLTEAQRRRLERGGERAWMVVYPDGGQLYDTVKRDWSGERLTAEDWAGRAWEAAQEAERAEKAGGGRVWEGVVIGGCCQVGFEEIGCLRKMLDQ